MQFSKLIMALKESKSNLLDYYIDKDPQINQGASIESAKSNQITFLEENNSLAEHLSNTDADAILLPNNKNLILEAKKKMIAWASFNNPKLAFAETLRILHPEHSKKGEIHVSAVIGKKVILGENVSIGSNVSIGEEVIIGDNTVIHPGVVLYDKVNIGENNILYANCVVHSGSVTGKDCIIHSNAVVGAEGFGFIPTEDGWKKMPQTGIVILENEVEVGCCTTIDRPSVGETRIGSNTKIDNLVQIGHGVTTGSGCAMAAQVGIAGGAKLGNGVILAGQVGVANRVKVGNKVIASSKCGIHTDIEEGKVISGFPAMSNKLWLRCSANFKKLPELAKNIRDLNRKGFRAL